MNWFIYALKNGFNFKDRARRREYGWFILMDLLISTFLNILALAAIFLDMPNLAGGIYVLHVIVGIILIIPRISLTTRRLHDVGFSGWWQLAPWGLLGLLFVAITVMESFIYQDVTSIIIPIFLVAISLLFFGFWLWLIFKDGQPHANKYGESPKAQNRSEIAQTF